MLKNNKGFTVVELIASFVFVSILSISLFAIVINYNNKEKDTQIKAELLAFKSKLTIDIEQDIQKSGLKRIDYCDSSLIDTTTSCINFLFNNGTTKQLKKTNRKCWEIYCDGVPQVNEENLDEPFCGLNPPEICQAGEKKDVYSYYETYLSYGGIRYIPPDYKNVTIDSDNMLEYTTPRDGLENNLTLYKINIKLTHIDIDADSDISIVAMGTEQINEGTNQFDEYYIGDKVIAQLNGTDRREFVVINNSGGYNGSVTLLYNDYELVDGSVRKFTDTDRGTTLPNPTDLVKFNGDISFGNRFPGSLMETRFVGNNGLFTIWYNADRVRLITTDEVARVASVTPRYRKIFDNVDDASENLNNEDNTAPAWLKLGKYWTSSAVSLSIDSSDKNGYLWVVDGDTGYLYGKAVNSEYRIRPVIEIDKVYVSKIE